MHGVRRGRLVGGGSGGGGGGGERLRGPQDGREAHGGDAAGAQEEGRGEES